jgi:cytochrome c oxidase assembly protein subunit 15
MVPRAHNSWLSRFSILTAVCTLFLICVGGLVTSHGVGMAVPDWPNTYGYNMFFFPFSQWIGGIFWEHSHRLVGSIVGLLVIILVFWLYGKKSRPLLKWCGIVFLVAGLALCFAVSRKWQDGIFLAGVGVAALVASFFWPKCEPAEKWMRRLGVIALVTVVFQGVLGGLRVTEMNNQIGVFHGTLAQMFFVLVSAIALFHTKFWRELIQHRNSANAQHSSLSYAYLAATLLILVQLILGATMRHQHAGLAIHDFPLAYGKIWPDMDPQAIERYNQARKEITAYNEITAFQVGLQMTHRIVAVLITISVALCLLLTKRKFNWHYPLLKFCAVWMSLIVFQFFLGAATIWTDKSADIATAHVAVGALSLVTGALLSITSFHLLKPGRATAASLESAGTAAMSAAQARS